MTLRTVFLLFSCLLIVSCKIDRKQNIDRDKFTFKTTDDSFLFFKNVRQIYYDFQDLPEARWHAFRLSDRSKSEEKPVLSPVIVIDWFKSEAYLLVEPNAFLQDEPELIIHERNSKSDNVYEYSLKERGRENMLEFATKIYEGIMSENEFYIKSNNQFIPLFTEDEDRENFRIVLADYYRLTRIF